MKLLTGVIHNISAGVYTVKTDMSSGSSKLQWSVDSDTFADVPASSKTASSGYEITLPACRLKSVLTGDATLSLNQVKR